MTALYVFDFDGVLFDTERETLEVAFRTVVKWGIGPWGDGDIPAEVVELFRRYRYLVGPPWQFAVLFEHFAAGDLPPSTEAFHVAADSRKAALAGFTESYFATRAALASDRPRWLALAAPFEAGARFAALHADGRAVILSTRDDDSIRAMCAHYLGVQHATLLPRSGPQPKWELLLEAAHARDLPPERVFFLDDHLAHALPARQHGIAARLATWGYLGPDDLTTARAAGLPCLQLSELDRAILEHQEHT